MAETEGFEPSVREYPVRRFSKPLVSATHPRLRKAAKRRYRGRFPQLQPRASLGYDLQPHVEVHLLPRVEHPHAERWPVGLRRVERGIGVSHGLGDESTPVRRRIELEETRVGR